MPSFFMGENMNIFDEYEKMICPYCKNKDTNLCEIRECIDGTIKCAYYQRDKEGNKASSEGIKQY